MHSAFTDLAFLMKFWHDEVDTCRMIPYDWQEGSYDQSPDVHSFQMSGTVHSRCNLNMTISSQKLIRIIAILREWKVKMTLDSIDQILYEIKVIYYFIS